MLSKEAKAKATRLLEVKANKKMIQQQLTAETGQVILLKDLTNLSSSLRKGKSRNDLDAAVNFLMDNYSKSGMTHFVGRSGPVNVQASRNRKPP